MTAHTGKNYERQVMRHLTEQDKDVVFELDIRIPALGTGDMRQIDVWLPRSREIIECKHHARPVDVGVIDSLLGKIDDVGASSGQVFSHSGFTRAARARAAKSGIGCETLAFEDSCDVYPERSGNGYYFGDYVDLCLASTRDCDSYGRINYADGDGNEWPVCVGHSVDWHNRQMHSFISYVLMTHYLGQPPAEEAITFFLEEYGKRFEEGLEWHIDESEVSRIAFAV
ncbi:restriction endonuclease [Streptomyces mirabilis]|uniref:restriction endonuclease n=1 Tax=Streptomyces mirabilis TaxID=68239 RepID=UPI003677D4F4